MGGKLDTELRLITLTEKDFVVDANKSFRYMAAVEAVATAVVAAIRKGVGKERRRGKIRKSGL